jgi:poly-gamma-glutamate system protein
MTKRLTIISILAVVAWMAAQEYGQSSEPHPLRDIMLASELRAERAFAAVDSVKRTGGLAFPDDSALKWIALLGEDYTYMTTTLGSRAAKEVSTNPAWASLLVRMLFEAGVGRGDSVAVLVSASFPALALSTLAALHEMGATPLVLSSMGASSYGANVRGATWPDWERWVRDAGVLEVHSDLVTAGGEEDAALGLPDEGRRWLEESAMRNGLSLMRYDSLAGAISARMALLTSRQPDAIVNIGGGHAARGACKHASSLPVGLWEKANECRCSDRGVLTRCAERGLPVIHLLQIRNLAARYGLDLEPGGRYMNSANITSVVRVQDKWVLTALSAITLSLVCWARRVR